MPFDACPPRSPERSWHFESNPVFCKSTQSGAQSQMCAEAIPRFIAPEIRPTPIRATEAFFSVSQRQRRRFPTSTTLVGHCRLTSGQSRARDGIIRERVPPRRQWVGPARRSGTRAARPHSGERSWNSGKAQRRLGGRPHLRLGALEPWLPHSVCLIRAAVPERRQLEESQSSSATSRRLVGDRS
jgi:hypothetical protein